jgi:hypothetical protein
MKHFKAGDKYNITYSTGKKWGQIAGECEIISVNEIPYNELQWRETSIKNWFEAIAGEIIVILRTNKNSNKPKTYQLNISKVSEELSKEYNRDIEEYWFSPGKRDYRTIDAK